MNKTLFCNKKCCKYYVSVYNKKFYQKPPKKEKTQKAGVFITTPDRTKILLVQSKGQFWGAPKGSLNPEETIKKGAIREVIEETGIVFQQDELNDVILTRGSCHYFYKTIDEIDLHIQTTIENNDANGIGWFNVECLKDMIANHTILINQHCVMLIKKILGYNMKFENNQSQFRNIFIKI